MNSTQGLELFDLLKQKVARQFADNSGIQPIEIQQWNSEHIRSFQLDLEIQVHERISERWIYTHLKKQTVSKLPRVDMLTILARYTGYKNWDEFVAMNPVQLKSTRNNPRHPRGKTILFIVGMIILTLLIFIRFKTHNSNYTYQFECVDEDLKIRIPSNEINIKILEEQQSPRHLEGNDSLGFQYQSTKQDIKFVIESPYYINDTIERHLEKARTEEKLYLKRDDYAILIQKYSLEESKNSTRRREFLKQILSEQIQVFQITPDNRGMEIFTKEEFINRMALPIDQLRNIEIVSTEYKDGKIIRLRFIAKDSPYEKAH